MNLFTQTFHFTMLLHRVHEYFYYRPIIVNIGVSYEKRATLKAFLPLSKKSNFHYISVDIMETSHGPHFHLSDYATNGWVAMASDTYMHTKYI